MPRQVSSTQRAVNTIGLNAARGAAAKAKRAASDAAKKASQGKKKGGKGGG